MALIPDQAPALFVSQWLNTPAPIDLADLRGKVVAIFAFQMLCPACVAHSLPQATQLRFRPSSGLAMGHIRLAHGAPRACAKGRAHCHALPWHVKRRPCPIPLPAP